MIALVLVLAGVGGVLLYLAYRFGYENGNSDVQGQYFRARAELYDSTREAFTSMAEKAHRRQ